MSDHGYGWITLPGETSVVFGTALLLLCWAVEAPNPRRPALLISKPNRPGRQAVFSCRYQFVTDLWYGLRMAFDPDPPLRAELNAALDVVVPQIAGLHHLEMVSALGADLQAEFQLADTERSRRRDRIVAVIQALDGVVVAYEALLADGYPTLAPVPIVAAVANELAIEQVLLNAAIAVFQEAGQETGDFNPRGKK